MSLDFHREILYSQGAREDGPGVMRGLTTLWSWEDRKGLPIDREGVSKGKRSLVDQGET